MTKKKESGFEALAKASIYPQEKLALVARKNKSFSIGLPKEISLQENRIVLTPDAVTILLNNSYEIWVEKHAGKGAAFSDEQYRKAGAHILASKKEVYQADIILKIEPPTVEEINLMKFGQVLISALQPGNLTKKYIQALLKKKITALAYEYIEDQQGGIPIVKMLSEIAGNVAIAIALEYLSSPHTNRGIIFGGVTGVPPTKMIVLGAGTVAEYCVRAALGMGAEVQVFDNHIYKLNRIKKNVDIPFYTSTIDNIALQENLKTADVVVGALRMENNNLFHCVSEDMVRHMKAGSLIIDLSIDHGGCVATSQVTSHTRPVFKQYGVIHYCVPNVGSRVPSTTANALSNVFIPILIRTSKEGGIEEMILIDKGLLKGVYAYKGRLSNKGLAEKFHMRYNNIELLMAARG